MPATFVLRGVRSPRTIASSVTCSIFPPSQAFQSLVRVISTAAARSRTTTGVAYFSHGQWILGCGRACSDGTAGVGAGVETGAGVEAAMVYLLGHQKVGFAFAIRFVAMRRNAACGDCHRALWCRTR